MDGISSPTSWEYSSTDTREKIDIVKLNAELQEIVSRENILRAEIDKIIKEIEI